LDQTRVLSGVSVDAHVATNGIGFSEGMLFTHRGLSGPSILQISSYWHEGERITVNLLNKGDLANDLKELRKTEGRISIANSLARYLPKALVEQIVRELNLSGNLADQNNAVIDQIAERVHAWQVLPQGTEGYRTAEVTLGGVDTDGLDAQTMASRCQEGLYIIGELVDVTGWLGGYNFQWAWSSGWVAGQSV